jgi:hypothetical protein
MSFKPKSEDLRDPLASGETLVRGEDAFDCDGVACGTAVADEDGGTVSFVRHDRHMVISGRNPAASPRYIAIPPRRRV